MSGTNPTRRPLIGLARFAGFGAVGGFIMGAAHPPYDLWFAAPAGATVLALISVRAHTDGDAVAGGYAFGLCGYGSILGWILNGVDAGNMPLLAYGGPLVAIGLFASAPAAIAFVARRSAMPTAARAVFLVPALWLLVEWSRHFTDFRFPWAHIGYTQIPDSPIAPLATVVGALGLGLVTMATGGLLALSLLGRRPIERLLPLAALLLPLLLARLTDSVEWTRPSGAPISIALLQGAFPMVEKFEPEAVAEALLAYAAFALDTRAKVTVMPETALPLNDDALPPSYLETLERSARNEDRDILVTFFRSIPDEPDGYHSSARVLGVSGPRDYDKRILAPFAEYVPAPMVLRPLYERVATVPLLDTEPGSVAQDPVVLGGVRVALRLCFEDLFPNHHRDEVAQAGILVVLANDSWNGTDAPMHQHRRVAQARALEAAKPLLRAGNTGWTGMIAPDGRLVANAPLHQRTVLEVSVQPRTGATPYVRYGDAIPVGLALLAFSASMMAGRSGGPAVPARRSTT